MAGCSCPTCEAQRAYCKRAEVRERHAAETRARRLRLSEEQHARINETQRARRRRDAALRDLSRLEALLGGSR